MGLAFRKVSISDTLHQLRARATAAGKTDERPTGGVDARCDDEDDDNTLKS